MEIITGTTDFFLREETAVAIGKFDGIHLGHKRLLAEILAQKTYGKKACVFTFDTTPARLFGNKYEKELTTREEKRRILEQLGIDILIEFPFNRDTAGIQAEVFVKEILCDRMHVGMIAAGTDISFGRGGEGNADLLCRLASQYGYEVRIIEKLMAEGREISSTLVREAIEKGDMLFAGRLLGGPYTVCGEVVHGNDMGHSLGMPTMNLIPSEDKLLPPNGVYYSGVKLDGVHYKGISNIGYKPTIEEEKKVMGVETYLYGFDGDAYGVQIEVSLYEFKRPERKFESLEALKAQVEEDIKAGEANFRYVRREMNCFLDAHKNA